MAHMDLNGTRLYYEDSGDGQPVVFIHGVWMSGRFFREQVSYFASRYRVLVPDLRGHGRSAPVQYGHTLPVYARDIGEMIDCLGLKDVVMVGWSMGSLVIWEYLRQFGLNNVKATVVIDQPATDFISDEWSMGLFNFSGLRDMMAAVQMDREGAVRTLIPLMFKDEPSEEDSRWMFDEIARLPESVASAILFDQTLRDYRQVIPDVNVPTLLCFVRDEKLYPVAAGDHILKNLPNARLVVFEESSHCPFLEEAERFNREVDGFIQSLD